MTQNTFIILIIFFSACVVVYESVMKIVHPQPVTNLWRVAAAAVLGFVDNEAVAVFRIKVGKEIGSAALIADGQHARRWMAIEIDPTLSISQGNEIAVAVGKALREHIPLVGGVAVRLFPATR
ncbi:MAG: cation transporter [Verrucomicrobiota bacterium]